MSDPQSAWLATEQQALRVSVLSVYQNGVKCAVTPTAPLTRLQYLISSRVNSKSMW